MGMRIIVGNEYEDCRYESAVFFCSVTEWAFGPVVNAPTGEARDKAEHFLDYVHSVTGDRELRVLPDDQLQDLYGQFSRYYGEDESERVPCECGHAASDHEWSRSRIGSDQRKCSAMTTKTENGNEYEETCECVGGWKPKKAEVKK